MTNLNDTTFIIPIHIESNDRYNNAYSVLGFLNRNFHTNVFIHELVDGKSKLNFLDALTNLNITHTIKSKPGSAYHRTKQLNEMLDAVTTPVTVNYDIDVILPPSAYLIAEKNILNKNSDLIYPYGIGMFQKMVFQNFDRRTFNQVFSIDLIEKFKTYRIYRSLAGHCQFFSTDVYRKYGGQNEHFISYAPEDQEMMLRFQKLGCKVTWLDNFVYHFEHSRTPNSNTIHADYTNNQQLFNKIMSLNRDELIKYYENVSYVKNYKNITFECQ